MNYNSLYQMQKETLTTAYSYNPQESLLGYAWEDQDDLIVSKIRMSPQEIRGWVHASKAISSQTAKDSSNILIRKRSLSTKRRTNSNVSGDTEQNKDLLKQKLNQYLSTAEDLSKCHNSPSSTTQSIQDHLLLSTIRPPSEDYVQGRKLKGFHRTFNLKRLQKSTHSASIDSKTLSRKKKTVEVVGSTNSSLRMRQETKRVGLVSYPIQIGFPCEGEDSRLRRKLHSYWQVNLKFRQT